MSGLIRKFDLRQKSLLRESFLSSIKGKEERCKYHDGFKYYSSYQESADTG